MAEDLPVLPDVVDAELADHDEGPARGLDISAFTKDTILVAGRPLPAAAAPPTYSAADIVVDESVAAYEEKVQRRNTARNYTATQKRFTAWCAKHKRVATPCTTATLHQYVVGELILTQQLRPNTVKAYKSAVMGMQPDEGGPSTTAVSYVIRQYEAEWNKKNTERRSPAIRKSDLLAMLATCDIKQTPADKRDAAILTLAWHLLTRRIEVASLWEHHVTIEDDGLPVRLTQRKTEKGGETWEGWVPAREDEPTLCPVRRMKAWMQIRTAIGARGGALFRALNRAGQLMTRSTKQTKDVAEQKTEDELTFLTGEAINDIVKRRARLAGISIAKDVTAHGLRAGGATELRVAGVSEDSIAELGDWTKDSKAMKRYFRLIKAREQSPWTSHANVPPSESLLALAERLMQSGADPQVLLSLITAVAHQGAAAGSSPGTVRPTGSQQPP